MSKKINNFVRGLDVEPLKKVIIFLKQEPHKQIKDNLGRYQICIRDNYINIYSEGCSLLKYSPRDKNKLMVHHKYLQSPGCPYNEKKPYVSLGDGEKIYFKHENIAKHTTHEKKAISEYLSAQKDKGGFLLLDLEVAFTRKRNLEEIRNTKTKKELVADRIDMACIYLKDGNPILKLIEVKLTNDKRLRSDHEVRPYKQPEIMKQMEHYQAFIKSEKPGIKNSYKTVAENYLELIKQNILPENYFSSIDGLKPIEILQKFVSNPQIEEEPYLLLLGGNCLTNGRNGQDHWQRLLELFKNKYPKPELWSAELCK